MSNFVSNLGGIFIYSRQPQALADWYSENLGIEYVHIPSHKVWFATFPYKDMATGRDTATVWSIMDNQDKPQMQGRIFCVNYRVSKMEDLLKHLQTKGIPFKGPEVHPEGIFAWIEDIDGNAVELWEDINVREGEFSSEESA